MRTTLIALLVIGAGAQQAQTPPATEIYLTRIAVIAGAPSVAPTAVNVTRNPGYDNQPSFTADGVTMLFTSNRDGKQTDIYQYDLGNGVTTQLTKTTEDEYSPLVTPDGTGFSTVRVEADKTQRLWRFAMDGSQPTLVLENVKPVGYHVWIDATHLALFVLGANGQPNTLQIADTATGTAATVDSNIGRSLLIRPGATNVTYVSKPTSGAWLVKELDPRTRTMQTLTPTVSGSEDCVWDPITRWLIMGKGSKLYGWQPGVGSWREIGDVGPAGVDKITRLAISPRQIAGAATLAIVAEPKAK